MPAYLVGEERGNLPTYLARAGGSPAYLGGGGVTDQVAHGPRWSDLPPPNRMTDACALPRKTYVFGDNCDTGVTVRTTKLQKDLLITGKLT